MKKAVVWVLIATIIIGFFSFAHKSALALKDFEWGKLKWHFLLFSVLLYCLVNFISFFSWRIMFLSLNKQKRSFRQEFKLWNYSLFGKYSVLGFGQPLARVYLASSFHLDYYSVFYSVILEQIFLVISAALFLVLGWYRFSVSVFEPAFLLSIAAILFFLSHPRMLGKMANFLLRILKKPHLEINFSFPRALGFVLSYLIVWGAISLSFYYLLRSFGLGGNNFIFCGLLICVAFLAGYFAPFIPAGLGVREGALSLLLVKFFDVNLALGLSVAFAFRLVVIISELLCFILAKSL